MDGRLLHEDLHGLNRTVLLVEPDLHFAFWFGRALDAADFETFPARSVPDAVELMTELQVPLDVAILNYSLAGAGNFVSTLRQAFESICVVALIQPDEAVPPDVDGVCHKRSELTETSKAALLEELARIIENPRPAFRAS